MKALLFIFVTSVMLSSAAFANGSSKLTPLSAGPDKSMHCPKYAICAPLATVPPILPPPPFKCPVGAMCMPMPKVR